MPLSGQTTKSSMPFIHMSSKMNLKALRRLTLRQALGLGLLVVSTVAWLFVFVVPFMTLDTARKAAIVAGLIVFGEVTGWLGLALLGKEMVDALRNSWRMLMRRLLRKTSEPREN